MKLKNLFSIFALAAIIAAPACSLDEDLSALSTPDNFFRKPAECRSVNNGCYIPLKSIYTYTYMLATECVSDIAYCPSGTLDARLDISPATPRFGSTVWTQCYQGVQRCNYAIHGIENSTAGSFRDSNGEIDKTNQEWLSLMCEAKVLRAFYYYTLTSFFGDVPFYFDDVKNQAVMDSLATLPRMNASETRDKVIADLLTVVPDAPQTRTYDNEENRLGAATGWMLIAKLAMWNKEWDVALNALKNLEKIYGDLSDYDYAENILFRNKNTPESIMEIQHVYVEGGTTYTSNVAAICQPRPRSNGNYYDGVQIPELGDQATVWAAMQPNVYFCQGLQTKKGKDLRKNYNMAWGYDGHDFNSVNTRPWCGPKFWCPNMYQTSDGNNYKVLRYAEVPLLMAECYNEKNEDETALIYLNKTRNRAGLDDYVFRTHVRLRDEIRNERARELFGEFQRKFDLVRWGIFYESVLDNSDYQALKDNIKPCHEYYPIPDLEVVKSKYNLDNKAYAKYGL